MYAIPRNKFYTSISNICQNLTLPQNKVCDLTILTKFAVETVLEGCPGTTLRAIMTLTFDLPEVKYFKLHFSSKRTVVLIDFEIYT